MQQCFRLRWKSSRTDKEVRVYGNRDSIRATLAFLLMHPNEVLNLRVEAIVGPTESSGDGYTDVTSEFAREHIYSVLAKN